MEWMILRWLKAELEVAERQMELSKEFALGKQQALLRTIEFIEMLQDAAQRADPVVKD